MSINEIKDAVLIGFFLSFMIGPVFFMLLQTSITKGARAALAFDSGVLLADVIFILIAYYGSISILNHIKDDPRLFFVGGLILLIYGLITFLDKTQKRAIQDETLVIPVKSNYVKLMAQGFLLNFINVGVLAFWIGMVVVVGSSLQMNATKLFHYFAVILLSYFITDIGKIVLAKQLKRKLTPKVTYKIKRVMGIILIVFGFVLIVKGFIPNDEIDINTVIDQAS